MPQQHIAEQTAPEALAKQLASHYCTPSFRDLQRTCSFLQAKADAAYEHNAQLAAELEETRESSRRDTLRLAMMARDLETRLAADADDCAAKEAARAASARDAAVTRAGLKFETPPATVSPRSKHVANPCT